MDICNLKPDKDGYLCNPETGERVPFFVCDPAKNVLCPKVMCRALMAKENEAEFGFCACTPEPAFRKEGTQPFYKRLNSDGYYGREYIDEEGDGDDKG